MDNNELITDIKKLLASASDYLVVEDIANDRRALNDLTLAMQLMVDLLEDK